MRVLQLLKTSVGASWAVRQVRELVKLDVDVHVAAPPGGPMLARHRDVGATVHEVQLDLPVRRPWQIPGRLRELRATVDAVRPDLVHSHFVGTTLTMRLGLRQRRGLPRVFQVPGPLHLTHAFFREAEIRSAQPQDYWIASCEWTRRCYRDWGIADNRLFLAYYGVDIETFRPQDPGRLRRELGLDADQPLAGMVAYMYAPKRYLGQTRGLKGHEDFIDAITICRERGVPVTGVLIGGAWAGRTDYEDRIRAYAQARCGDAVVCLGTRDDVPDLYADLDVVVHPSHSENVGGAVESLLLARPTIATNVGGFPDLVVDGKTGWLVPPRAPAVLADRIVHALEHPEEAARLAQQGQERCRRMFDIRGNAADVHAAYQAILEREAAR